MLIDFEFFLGHLFKYISYRKRVKPILYICKAHTKIRKKYFLDTTIFLAKDLANYAKMIPLWVFFVLSQHFVLVFREQRNSK